MRPPEAAPGQPHPQPDGHGPASQRLADLVYVIVLAGVIGALLWMWLSGAHVKEGTMMIAGWLLVAAGARLVLPGDPAGLLTGRRRAIDVAAFAILGVGLFVAALVIPTPS